jgi:hypothetical protein
MKKIKKQFKIMALAFTFFALASTVYAQMVSDKDMKTNVVGISNSLEKLKQLEPVIYEYDTHKYKQLHLGKGKKYGFLAENFYAVFPEMVYNSHIPYMYGKNHQKDVVIKKIDTESLIPVLVASIKELEAEIEKLKVELIKIKATK